MILFFRWKMKDYLSEKIHENMIFLQMPRKDDISEKWRWNMVLLVLSGNDSVSLLENIIFFIWTENKT